MKPNKRFPLFLPLLALLCFFSAGCAVKEPHSPRDRMPGLADDPAFIADLARSRTKGLSGITVIAPSSGLRVEHQEPAHALAEKLGVTFPRTALGEGQVPYNANSDQIRLKLLAGALADPGTEVLWGLRGGYGSSRLLEGLSRLTGPEYPKKIIIGYSDITFLHLFFQKKGWQTIHGSLFWEMTNPSKEEDNFRLLAALLSGRVKELRYEGLTPYNEAALKISKPIRAAITGGNLTCIAAATGTPWALDAAGKILFLEDVKEPGYTIDRMLTQLRLAGSLKGVKTVILGSFSAGDRFIGYALERFATECPIPVFTTDQFGHGPKNYPLIFNAPAVLEKSAANGGAFSLRIRADQFP